MTQKEALAILKAGYNVYLTGAAGSGKTHLLNEFIGFLKNKGVCVGVTASTGIAATHIGGLTIHSWAGIGINCEMSDEDCKDVAASSRVAKRFKKTEVLVIDEISMLDADRLSLVDRVARFARGRKEPFGGMQVVFCGDFFQLPPVSPRISQNGEIIPDGAEPSQFAYKSPSWRETSPKICYLTERFRHDDPEFLSVLDAVRGATVDDAAVSRLNSRLGVELALRRATKLYSHNADVDEENMKELARLDGKEARYYMKSRGVPKIVDALKRGCLAPEELALKKGAAVMFVKNNFEEGYVNGTLGEVVGENESGQPIVKIANGRKIEVYPAKWSVEDNGKVIAEITQLPLRLAWAITIHKSQGMTLDAAEIDLSSAFEKGMGYVALSRVRSLRGIRLLGINKTALEVSPEVLEFDAELRRQSEETVREFDKLFVAADGVKDGKDAKTISHLGAKSYSLTDIRKNHHAAYEKWSREEESRLTESFFSGVTVPQIAKQFGRKLGGIRARLKKLGLIS